MAIFTVISGTTWADFRLGAGSGFTNNDGTAGFKLMFIKTNKVSCKNLVTVTTDKRNLDGYYL